MPNNKISPDLFSSASDVRRRTTAPRPSLAARVTALLRAHHLDRQLAVGVRQRPEARSQSIRCG